LTYSKFDPQQFFHIKRLKELEGGNQNKYLSTKLITQDSKSTKIAESIDRKEIAKEEVKLKPEKI